MTHRIAEVDAYIAGAAPFARPILEHLRARVHSACPAVQESIKWSMPFFVVDRPLCHMAAFKQHCAFGFWKHKAIFGDDPVVSDAAMGQFGRITTLGDLPDDATLIALIRQAAVLADSPASPMQAGISRKPPPIVPDDLRAALSTNAVAHTVFESFSPGNRREYIDWITEAKTAATRERRLHQALEWIVEGKRRNWQYERAK